MLGQFGGGSLRQGGKSKDELIENFLYAKAGEGPLLAAALGLQRVASGLPGQAADCLHHLAGLLSRTRAAGLGPVLVLCCEKKTCAYPFTS